MREGAEESQTQSTASDLIQQIKSLDDTQCEELINKLSYLLDRPAE